MMRKLTWLRYGSVSLLALVLTSARPVQAEPLQPRAEVSVKGGTDRSLLTTEFWAPLAQQKDKVLYGDIRLMGDNDQNREGNLGVGYRQVSHRYDAVFGMYGWIDRRRTQHNSTFHQLTFGVERLGHVVDTRANIYIPINQGRQIITPNIGRNTPYLTGSGIYYDTTGSINEVPQYGIDGEIGFRIPVWQKQIDAIRVYGGGYYFFRDNTTEVPGIRLRSEAQINQAISLGATFQYDEPRGEQGFIEATLKFPFSAKRLYQQSGLRSRLDESPQRDVDIVTDSKIDTGLFKSAINSASGTAQRVIYVDNSKASGGDGSYEKPFNNLKSAESVLQANDIVYINRGDGTSRNMDQGIVVNQSNVQLIGSGSALTYGGYTLLAAGAAPMITNTATTSTATPLIGNAVLSTIGNISISGLNLSNATFAGINVLLDGKSADYVTVDNVTINNSQIIGLSIKPINGGALNNVILSNSHFEGNGTVVTAGGAYIGAETNSSVGTVTANNNSFTNNRGQGLAIDAWASRIGNVNVLNNVSTGNISNIGIYVRARDSGGRINNIIVDNNTASNNGAAGIDIFASTSGYMNTISANGNITNNNTGTGIRVSSLDTGTSIGQVTMSNSIANGNTVNGVGLRSTTGGVIGVATIQGASTASNTQNGVGISAGHTIGTLTVSDIRTTGNTVNGVLFSSASGALVNAATFRNISSTANSGSGFSFTAGANIGTLNMSGVTTSNNLSTGLVLSTGSTAAITSVVLQNMTSNNNTGSGIQFNLASVLNSINMTDITANQNAGRGVNITTTASTGIVGQISIDRLTANNNTSGLAFAPVSGQINNITATNITANNNITGVYLLADAAGSINGANLSNVTANNNSQFGIYVSLTNTGGLISNVSVSNSNTSNNTQYGIGLSNTKANGTFYVDLGGGLLNSLGQNRSFNNSLGDLRVSFTTGATVSAQNNWWGNAAGLQAGRMTVSGGSTVVSSVFLTTDPRP